MSNLRLTHHFFSKLLVGCFLLWLPALATANYSSHPQAKQFIDRMVEEHDFERDWLKEILSSAERNQAILDAIARPAERVLEWKDYRRIFIRDARIEGGIAFWDTHADTLARAEQQFGVPASVIVAIIGVETMYGTIKGSYRVIDALATLGFDYPPRSSFFSRELEHYLLLVREQQFDPLALKGSYAGAMGYGQFISSSYRAYAVDFDGDGIADIIHNPVDAIGSVANYFSRHGWRTGEPVVSPARVSDHADSSLFNSGLRPGKNLAEFAAAGIEPGDKLPGDYKATAWRFQGEEGEELWLGLHNFYVITRYNHSAMYAMAVHQLSEILEEQMKQ